MIGFNAYLASLVTGWTQLETSLGSIARVRNLEIEVQSEAKEGENREPPSIWPKKGGIIFKNLTASYKLATILFPR